MQKCFNCLEETQVTRYPVAYRNYGSSFDSIKSFVELCNECKKLVKEEWFYEVSNTTDPLERYKYEDLLFDFINSLPIEGQYMFWVKYNTGVNFVANLDLETWIDWSE